MKSDFKGWKLELLHLLIKKTIDFLIDGKLEIKILQKITGKKIARIYFIP